jgi:hypothetical protein
MSEVPRGVDSTVTHLATVGSVFDLSFSVHVLGKSNEDAMSRDFWHKAVADSVTDSLIELQVVDDGELLDHIVRPTAATFDQQESEIHDQL